MVYKGSETNMGWLLIRTVHLIPLGGIHEIVAFGAPLICIGVCLGWGLGASLLMGPRIKI